MKKRSLIISLSSLVTFFACDKVDDPYPSELGKSIIYNNTEYIVDQSFGVGNINELNSFINDNTWESKSAPDNSAARFVLIEEFTGHLCVSCPQGTKEIIRLDGIYGDTLIPVGIHAGGFAAPERNTGRYSTDFRVEGGHGEVYIELFKANFNPSGVVSRLGDASKRERWEQDILSIKNDLPSASIKMTNYYSSVKNAVRSNIEITWLANIPEEFNLQLYLLEDHIIDWQYDAGVDIQYYDHRHVLRKVINDTFGKSLSTAVKDETEKFEYIFSVNPNWKPQDMEVVAFIFNNDDTNYEVIQSNAAHIK